MGKGHGFPIKNVGNDEVPALAPLSYPLCPLCPPSCLPVSLRHTRGSPSVMPAAPPLSYPRVPPLSFPPVVSGNPLFFFCPFIRVALHGKRPWIPDKKRRE